MRLKERARRRERGKSLCRHLVTVFSLQMCFWKRDQSDMWVASGVFWLWAILRLLSGNADFIVSGFSPRKIFHIALDPNAKVGVCIKVTAVHSEYPNVWHVVVFWALTYTKRCLTDCLTGCVYVGWMWSKGASWSVESCFPISHNCYLSLQHIQHHLWDGKAVFFCCFFLFFCPWHNEDDQ